MKFVALTLALVVAALASASPADAKRARGCKSELPSFVQHRCTMPDWAISALGFDSRFSAGGGE
jgi:hypothetical protein